MKWVLLAIVLLVLWYVVAPWITPRQLRPPKRAGETPPEAGANDNAGRKVE